MSEVSVMLYVAATAATAAEHPATIFVRRVVDSSNKVAQDDATHEKEYWTTVAGAGGPGDVGAALDGGVVRPVPRRCRLSDFSETQSHSRYIPSEPSSEANLARSWFHKVLGGAYETKRLVCTRCEMHRSNVNSSEIGEPQALMIFSAPDRDTL